MRPEDVRELLQLGFKDAVAETDIIYKKYLPPIYPEGDVNTDAVTNGESLVNMNSPYLNNLEDPYINEEHPVIDGGKKYGKPIFLRGYWKKDLRQIEHKPNLDEKQDVIERDEGFAVFEAKELELKKLWNYKINWTSITTDDILIHGDITYKIIGVDSIGKVKSKYLTVKIRWYRDIRDER